MSKINQTPRGLQSLLSNVNQGINPSELDQNVSAGLDLLPFWGTDKLAGVLASASIAGTIGQGVNVVVPTGELWIPLQASVQRFAAVGTTLGVSLRINNPNQNVSVIVTQATRTNVSNVSEVNATAFLSGRYVLPPGWIIRGQIDECNDATGATMEVNMMYYKLKG